MTASGFNFGAAIAEGIMACLILGLVSKRKPDFRVPFYALFIVFEIASVVWHYASKENSTFFFAHPYIAFLISDISDYSTYIRGIRGPKEAAFEKLLLWPVIVIPVLSAFVLTTGWLIKLYGRYLIH